MKIGIIGAGPEDKDLDELQKLMVQSVMVESTAHYLTDYYTSIACLEAQGYTKERASKIVEDAMAIIKEKFDRELLPEIEEENKKMLDKVHSDMASFLGIFMK